MSKILPVSKARADIYNLMDYVAMSHEPVFITGKRNNAVMVSEEDWRAIQEMIYINSIPNLAKTLQDSLQEDDSQFVEHVEW